MALTLLLQPQILQRFNALQADQAFADDAVALLQRIFAEPANMITLAAAFEKGFKAMGERFLGTIEPRLGQITGSLRDLLAPLLEQVQGMTAQAQTATSAGDVAGMLCGLLDTAASFLASLDEPQLRSLARRVDTLLSDTLGLNQDFLHQELRQIYATARAHLLEQVPTLEPKQAAIALAAGSFIGRIEDQLLARIPKLDLNPDRLAQQLIGELDKTGFEAWRGKLVCIIQQLRTIVASGTALFDLAKPSVFGPSSGGAAQVRPPLATDEYCWYASWLYKDQRRTMLPEPSESFWPSVGHLTLWGITQIPGFPGDEVWLGKADAEHPGGQLLLRRAFWDDAVLHDAAQDFSWDQAPQFTSASGKEAFTFGHLSPSFMEGWTRVSAGVLEFAKAGGHIAGVATEQGYVTNVPLTLWNPLRAASTALVGAPLPSYLNHKLGWSITTEALIYSPIPLLAGLLGKIEDVDKEKKIDALDTLFATAPEVFKADTSGLLFDLNEGILAFFTLLNYRGPGAQPAGDDTRPLNRESDGPIVSLVDSLVAYIVKATTPPDVAKRLAPKNEEFWLYLLLYVPVMSMAGALVSTLLCWTVAQAVTVEQFWKNPLKQAGKSAAKFFFKNVGGPEE